MNTEKIDRLGHELGQAALRTLVRLCPEVRTASDERVEAACAAMRAAIPEAVDELLADTQAAPWLAEVTFTSAVLTLVHAGIAVLRPAAESLASPSHSAMVLPS
jgi:hypothetical protein